jgi:hypothetical protein
MTVGIQIHSILGKFSPANPNPKSSPKSTLAMDFDCFFDELRKMEMRLGDRIHFFTMEYATDEGPLFDEEDKVPLFAMELGSLTTACLNAVFDNYSDDLGAGPIFTDANYLDDGPIFDTDFDVLEGGPVFDAEPVPDRIAVTVLDHGPDDRSDARACNVIEGDPLFDDEPEFAEEALDTIPLFVPRCTPTAKARATDALVTCSMKCYMGDYGRVGLCHAWLGIVIHDPGDSLCLHWI